MKVSAISPAEANLAPTIKETGFTSQDFMTLLIAQLRNQNPLEPMKGHEFMAQLAQLESVAKLNDLADAFTQFGQIVELALPASLLGRTVTWQADDGSQQHGEVEGVSFPTGSGQSGIGSEPTVLINGQEVGLGSILLIG